MPNLDDGYTFGGPRDPREIATDENLSLAALENQMRAEQDKNDPHAMTADKLAGKFAGMGIAGLQLGDGLAQHYDLHAWREEDEEILRAEQAKARKRTWMQTAFPPGTRCTD